MNSSLDFIFLYLNLVNTAGFASPTRTTTTRLNGCRRANVEALPNGCTRPACRDGSTRSSKATALSRSLVPSATTHTSSSIPNVVRIYLYSSIIICICTLHSTTIIIQISFRIVRSHSRLHRSHHLQGVPILCRWYSSRLRLLDGRHLRSSDHHASARPQGGPKRDGEGRSANNANRIACHSSHAYARTIDSMGGRRSQVLAQALNKASSSKSHISE